MAEDAGVVSEYRHLFGVRVANPIDMDEAMLKVGDIRAGRGGGGTADLWCCAYRVIAARLERSTRSSARGSTWPP
jgi:hypothetical protein